MSKILRIPLDIVVDDRTLTGDQVQAVVTAVLDNVKGSISPRILQKTMHDTKPETSRVHLHLGDNCPECFALVNDGKK